MTRKASSKEEPEVKVEDEPELEVKVEEEVKEPIKEEVKKEPPKEEEDVVLLKQQLADLRNAQEASQARIAEAERRAQQAAHEVSSFRQSAEQSQYDSIVTALGASQVEVDAAKRDIMMAGSAQDYQALADAQERLAAAKARMVSLESGKDQYEAQRSRAPDPVANAVDNNPNLTFEEKTWLKAHPDAMSDARKNAKLNAAYFDAMDKGLQRGTQAYFNYIEEQMGYRQPTNREQRTNQEPEEEVIVAAPPSRESRGPSGSAAKTVHTLTKEEAEIAKLSGITPAEYVKQKLKLLEEQRIRPGDYPRG